PSAQPPPQLSCSSGATSAVHAEPAQPTVERSRYTFPPMQYGDPVYPSFPQSSLTTVATSQLSYQYTSPPLHCAYACGVHSPQLPPLQPSAHVCCSIGSTVDVQAESSQPTST